jgi:hypothetical protein
MAFLRAGLPNFSKGVLSERLHGRTDVAAYNAGLKRGENIVILKQGAFSIRPGFRYVNDCLGEGEWLVPFQFSDEQPYALTFGQEYMQPLTGGGVVIEAELAITGITNAAQAVLSVDYHGLVVGDQVFLAGIDGAMGDLLNERVWNVMTVPTDGTFSIDADTSAVAAFSGATGGATNVAPPPPPPDVPPTPPPYEPPPAPPVYGGGRCVSDDTPILLADGSEAPARDLVVGTILKTRPELEDGSIGEWGEYRVSAIEFADEPVWRGEWMGRELRATTTHRVWIADAWFEWASMPNVRRAGTARVAKITVEGAHTYVSAGLLSHNIKADLPDQWSSI